MKNNSLKDRWKIRLDEEEKNGRQGYRSYENKSEGLSGRQKEKKESGESRSRNEVKRRIKK